MADDVARLVAVVEANIKNFTKGMDQAQKVADRRFGQIEKRMKKTESVFAGSFKNVGRFLLGGAALAGITRFVSSVTDAVGKLQDTSDALGISTDALQTYGIIAGRSGVRQEELNKALGAFTQKLGEAQIKGGPFAKFLNGIGVGTQGNAEQVLLRIADAVKNTSDKSQKAAIVAEALGARYVRLVPLFEQGADGLAKLNFEFAKNGQIINRETIAKLDELGDKWADLKRQFTVIGANVLGGIADEFSEFSADLTSPEFQTALKDFGKLIADAAIGMARIAASFGSFASFIGLVGGKDELTELRDLITEQKAILAEAGGKAGPVFMDNLIAAEKRYQELLRNRAKLAGIPFAPPGAAPIAPGIDRTGTLETESGTGGKTVAERERALEIETTQKIQDAVGDIIRKRLEEDAEFRAQQFEEGRDRQNQAFSDELDDLDDFHTRAKEAWERYYESLPEQAQEAAELEARANQQRADNLDDTLSTISTLTQSSSKELQAIGKAAAIAQATMDGIVAVNKALASAPPPFNFALAALVGAAVAANIAQIAAMEKGGRVQPGTPYIVGEKRPELFVPDSAGTIIPRVPNIASPTMGERNITMSFNNQNSFAGAVDANSIRAYADQVGATSAASAIKAVRREFPTLMVKAQRDRL